MQAGSCKCSADLAQDDPQGVDDAGEAAQDAQDDVDPQFVVDFVILEVYSERGDEDRQNYLYSFVIHSILLWLIWTCLVLLYDTMGGGWVEFGWCWLYAESSTI